MVKYELVILRISALSGFRTSNFWRFTVFLEFEPYFNPFSIPQQDGKGFKRVLDHNAKLVHPFSVTVHKELVYWDDWEKKAIFMADKNSGKGVVKVMGDLAGAMDMKAFNRLHQVLHAHLKRQ